jgi:hypothetical protein
VVLNPEAYLLVQLPARCLPSGILASFFLFVLFFKLLCNKKSPICQQAHVLSLLAFISS